MKPSPSTPLSPFAQFIKAGSLPSNFSQLAAAVRAARFASEEGDADDEQRDDYEDAETKKRKAKAKSDIVDGDKDDDDGDEKRKDAASAEFIQRFLIAGQKRRGEVEPPEPTDAVARAIVAAGRRRRGEI